ncbi:SPOSA6832_01312, partial [Sporobolomyces salmonicolor]
SALYHRQWTPLARHVSRSVERYLKWLGVKTEVFSLGDHRRRMLGPSADLPKDYFSLDNRSPETDELRKKVRLTLEEDVARFFKENRGQVAIYDANNGTKAARIALRQKFEAQGVNVFFIENICDRDDIVEANIRSVKLSSPDYKGWNPEQAVKDYMMRIAEHAKRYETMETSGGPFVKIYNIGERLVVNNIRGYLQSRIVFFLMNVHHKKRTIWFARSGQSDIEHSFKADSDLSPQGIEYAEKLRDFIVSKRRELLEERIKSGEQAAERRLTVWTSARRRCISTARPMAELGYKIVQRQQMYELNPGDVDGLSPEQIRAKFPDEFAKAEMDPYGHRYPRAESYHDLSVRCVWCLFLRDRDTEWSLTTLNGRIRLEPVILELEREPADILFIGHGSVIRCLMAYLQGLTPHEIPKVELRRGDIVQVTPSAYGVKFVNHFFWQ